MEELAEFWRAWSEYNRPIQQAVTWADVKSNIVVKEVAAPATTSFWTFYQAALMLMECDAPSSSPTAAASNLAGLCWHRTGTIWWVDSSISYLPMK